METLHYYFFFFERLGAKLPIGIVTTLLLTAHSVFVAKLMNKFQENVDKKGNSLLQPVNGSILLQ